MKSFRRLISLFLLAAISFYVAPQDLLHELAAHEHTQDVICTDYCAHHVSKEHHHCDCLQLSVPPLYHSLQNFSFVLPAQRNLTPQSATGDYHFSLSPFLFFRGPPS